MGIGKKIGGKLGEKYGKSKGKKMGEQAYQEKNRVVRTFTNKEKLIKQHEDSCCSDYSAKGEKIGDYTETAVSILSKFL